MSAWRAGLIRWDYDAADTALHQALEPYEREYDHIRHRYYWTLPEQQWLLIHLRWADLDWEAREKDDV